MKTVIAGLLWGIIFVMSGTLASWLPVIVLPDDQQPESMWVHSENCVYVKTGSELIYKWNGQEWISIDSPLSGYIYYLVGFDDFIVMSRGAMFYWYDSGEWQTIRLASDDSNRYTAIAGNSRENVFIMVNNGVFQYVGGEWIQILTTADMAYSHTFKSIFLTNENDLFVIGQNYSYIDTWWWGMRVRLWFDEGPSCYKKVGDTLVPFLNTGDDESAEIIGGWSTEDLYLWNSDTHGFGSGKVIHHNGEFFTCMAQKAQSMYLHGSTQDSNNLIFSSENQFVIWDGLIPRMLEPLEFDDGKERTWERLSVGGVSTNDFWVLSSQNQEIYRWKGQVPDVPYETGAFLKMDDYRVHAGEAFHVQVAAGNATDEVLTGDVYVCMMIFGTDGLWFWPNWTKAPSQIDPVRVMLEPHSFQYFDVFNLTWPDIDATVDGLFHSIMVTDTGEISELQSVGFSVQ